MDLENMTAAELHQHRRQIDAELSRRSPGALKAGANRASAYLGANGTDAPTHSIESGAERARNFIN